MAIKLKGSRDYNLIEGTNGADTLVGTDGNDLIRGRKGGDHLDGGKGDDLLRGGQDNDTLLGGNGNDILIGGAGADYLEGGLGADTFVFNSLSGGPDIMEGFYDIEGDVLDFSRIITGFTEGDDINNFVKWGYDDESNYVVYVSPEGDGNFEAVFISLGWYGVGPDIQYLFDEGRLIV